jgi:hypothetical protein
MVNIEKLSEEDQRKYTELQEYIKVTMTQEFSCQRSRSTTTRLR